VISISSSRLFLADLDLQLEVGLVGHMHREAQTAAFELDLVVPSERVCESVAAAGSLPDDHPAAAIWWRILDQLPQTPNQAPKTPTAVPTTGARP
jgi:hypothetical protein